MRFTVNGKEFASDRNYLEYDEVIGRAGYGSHRIVTVTYHGPKHGDSQRSGTLTPGQFVTLEEDMRFNVADTSHA